MSKEEMEAEKDIEEAVMGRKLEAFLVQLVIGESQLEEYLLEYDPNDKNQSKAKSLLRLASDYLRQASQSSDSIGMQATMLLAKLFYCSGEFNDALQLIDCVKFSVKQCSSFSRLFYIFAEAYAIKGMCLEKVFPAKSSRFKAVNNDQKVIDCYEKSGDMALLFVQETERNIQQTHTSSTSSLSSLDNCLGFFVNHAIQQAPLCHIRKGNIRGGVNRFRELLCAVECCATQHIRMCLARHLAELFIRGVSKSTYEPFDMAACGVPSCGQKPHIYGADRLTPEDVSEETLLLLLIAESLANREAVLDQSREVEKQRQEALRNATSIYDLLATVLVRKGQFSLLLESYERALRFSHEEFHIWHQVANSLICSGKYARALLVLGECHRLKPKNCVVPLQAAKLCYEYLHMYTEGINWACRAIDIDNAHPLLPRSYVALGVGLSLSASEAKLQADRTSLYTQAFSAFKRAFELEPLDHVAAFHLALQLAIFRQISEAMRMVHIALKLCGDHLHSLHLLVLLLSSCKQYEQAFTLLLSALEEYPDNLSLLLTKSKLEEFLIGPEEALLTCKRMMCIWKEIHEIDHNEDDVMKCPENSTLDRKSIAQSALNEFSDRGSGSAREESQAASHVEQTLSDVVSSQNSLHFLKHGFHQSWLSLAQIWLHLADLYLMVDNVSEAESCVAEASSIFPLSHQVCFMKGRILEHKCLFDEARGCYVDTIAINPGHTKSLHHLGLLLHKLGDDKLAEKILRDAVNSDPTSYISWYALGTVLHSLGFVEASSNCHLTSTSLQSSSPVVPFTVIPRLIH